MEGGAPMESHGRPVEKHRVAADEEYFHLVFSNKTENDERVLAVRRDSLCQDLEESVLAACKCLLTA